MLPILGLLKKTLLIIFSPIAKTNIDADADDQVNPCSYHDARCGGTQEGESSARKEAGEESSREEREDAGTARKRTKDRRAVGDLLQGLRHRRRPNCARRVSEVRRVRRLHSQSQSFCRR